MKKTAAILLSISILSSFSVTVNATRGENVTAIYVATDGNDGGNGTKENPFASLEKAREHLRELKKQGAIGTDGAVVYIRGGVYQRTKGFTLTAEDSGTENAPIVWRAYPGEEVEFMGGVNLTAKDFSKVTDQAEKDKIGNAEATSKIVYVDLNKYNIKYVDTTKNGSYTYTSYMEELTGKAPTDYAPEVFVDGVSYTVARYPNDRDMIITEIIDKGSEPRYATEDMTYEEKFRPFKIKPEKKDEERSARWKNAENALLYGKFLQSWADQTVPLKSIENGVIESEWPSLYSVAKERPFYIYNLLEELDIEGEYYIDKAKNRLYIYPPQSNNYNVVLTSLNDVMFDINGASYVTLKDINMTSNNLSFKISGGSKKAVFDSGFIRYNQARAGNIGDCTESGIKNYYIYDVNGGVSISGGDMETLEKANNFIENCEFENFARLQKTYNSAISVSGVGNRIVHNEIHEAEHLAMTPGGVNNIIAYNEFYDVCKNTDDAGVIYGGRAYLLRGNRIMYNYFHDIESETTGSFGVHGVYLDDGFSGGIVVGNVFENLTGTAIFFAGKDNYAANNVFINIGKNVITNSPRLMNGVGQGSGPDVAQYLLDSLKNIPYKNEYWQKEFPEVYNAETDMFPKINVNNVWVRNLSYKSPAIAGAQGENTSENNWKTDSDPGFYDLANRNYLLKPDAEVFKKIEGFEPIPFTRMGRYSDRAMERISNAVSLFVNSPYAFVNADKKVIDEANEKVVPVIIDNSTYLPIRFISEGFGAKVEYNDETKDATITLNGKSITINSNTTIAKIDSEEIDMEVKPIVMNSRTYVPLRKVSELLDKKVTWDDSGLITVSDTENLLDSNVDRELIDYISSELTIY